MKLEVLISTVECKDLKQLIIKMNIQTDAIIINQCDHIGYEEIEHNKHLIRIYHFNERGIGLSRNNALMRSDADIILFADDDEILENNYERKIISEFKKNRTADMFVFNIKSFGGIRNAYNIEKVHKVKKYNSLRYGAVRFAVQLKKIRNNNINFSLLFGGGAKYGSGEDSIFIYDCLKSGLKIYTSPVIIGKVDFSESSWFNGYTEKYYFDKGALFFALHKRLALFFASIYLIRHYTENSKFSFRQKLVLFKQGINDMKGNGKYEK